MLEKYISSQDEKEIVEAIQIAEKNTSGEIRVHIELRCPLEDTFKRATEVFYSLNMQKTILKNGVLIYLSLEDRRFYILGDCGINERVGQGFWDKTRNVMLQYFKQKELAKGLIEGILSIGNELKHYFPYQKDDINELSDEISKG